MKDLRFWLCAWLLLVASVLIGDAQLAPNHVPYRPEATHEKQLERAVRGRADTKMVAKPPQATDEKQLERAESTIAKYYDEVGKRLTATLADDEIPIPQRVQAAKRLGIMKYPPAIPTLIRNNLLLDPDIVISGNENEPFVAVNALVQYGDAAVPQIIDAYLEEENKSDRSRLRIAIGSRRTALVYAKGLATDIEKDRSKRLDELIKGLSQ